MFRINIIIGRLVGIDQRYNKKRNYVHEEKLLEKVTIRD